MRSRRLVTELHERCGLWGRILVRCDERASLLGLGWSSSDGLIVVCNPGADLQCDSGDWSTSRNAGAAEYMVRAMMAYNGGFCMRIERNAAGNTTISVCRLPGIGRAV